VTDGALFAPKSNEDKQEDFARSTMRLIARQLGQRPEEVSEGADWHWFNQHFTIPGFWVGSMRIFRFDIVDLLFRPTKHPVMISLQEFRKELPNEDDDFIMVFQVYEWGRMIATNHDFKDLTALRVVIRDEPIWVAPLGNLFTQWNPSHG